MRNTVIASGLVITLLILGTSGVAAQGRASSRISEQVSLPDKNKATIAFPTQPERPPVPLSALIADVLERSPDLVVLEQRVIAARARVPQAGALPDPMFEYGVMNEGGPVPFQALGKNGFSEVYVGVTQEMPYPGKRGLRERVAQEDVEVERLRRDARVRELVVAVKETYVEIYS